MLDIIAETAHWIAVVKPCNMLVERNPFGESVESLLEQYLKQSSKKPFVGIAHRIDRVTSGLVLVAKKKSTLKWLNEQFSTRQVQKTYLAAVEQMPPNPQGVLKHWLEKDLLNKKAIIWDHPGKNRQESILEYRFIQHLPDEKALLELKPLSGRFHQIRAQLSAIGCPIIGDDKYGGQTAYQPDSIQLHAWKLRFQPSPDVRTLELETPAPGW